MLYRVHRITRSCGYAFEHFPCSCLFCCLFTLYQHMHHLHGLSISIIHRFRLPDQPTYGDGQVLGYKCEQSDPLVCSVVYILGHTAMSSHKFCKCFYIILNFRNVILILMHKNTVHKHNQFMKVQNTESLVYNWTSLVGCCSIHINED